jgi:hypothetical protein
MNWTSIILAAVAGGIAGIVARLIANPKENRNTYLVAFFAVFGGLYLLSRSVILPKVELRQAEAKLLEIPAFKALRLHDSDAYGKLMDEVKVALKGGKKEGEIFGIFRKHMVAIVEDRLPKASNDAVVEYIAATMAEMDELYRRGDDTCHRFMFPAAGEMLDARQYFSKEVQDRDLAALARVIETSARDPQRVPEDFEVLPRLQPIIEELTNEYGSSIALMQNPGGARNERKRKVCEMASSMYAKILDLPTEDGGKILRFLVRKG